MPPYTYDPKAVRYRDSRGRFVTRKVVYDALLKVLTESAEDMQDVWRSAYRGDVTLRTLQITMEREIKNAHLLSATLARGGINRMRPADYGRVGGFVRREYEYFNNLIRAVSDGLRLDGNLLNRVKAYFLGGLETFNIIESEEMVAAGLTREFNVLGVAEHCTSCEEETDKGWVAIGTLIPIGRRKCLHNCRCRIIYAK